MTMLFKKMASSAEKRSAAVVIDISGSQHKEGVAGATQRVAIYMCIPAEARGSKDQQLLLGNVAAERGGHVIDVYVDQRASDAKGWNKRPAFDRLRRDALNRRFDAVMAWSIECIGRSAHGVSGFMAEMDALGIAQYYHQQAIDTSTPIGKSMIRMGVIFAEFDRDLLRGRIVAGLRRARAQGTRLGRPRIDPKKESAIRAALAEGQKGIRRIASELGVGVATVQRVKAGMAEG
jgi:DNA invertase Pin-like site-specific DNA recombinase